MDEKHLPLRLPEGSIRAILALVAIFTWSLIAIILIFVGEYKEALKIISDPPIFVLAIIGYYFTYRTIKTLANRRKPNEKDITNR